MASFRNDAITPIVAPRRHCGVMRAFVNAEQGVLGLRCAHAVCRSCLRRGSDDDGKTFSEECGPGWRQCFVRSADRSGKVFAGCAAPRR
jgi:hypothetical protein